jgi:hypothetical protein
MAPELYINMHKYTKDRKKMTLVDSPELSSYEYVATHGGQVISIPTGELHSSLATGSARGSGMYGLHSARASGFNDWVDLQSQGLSACGVIAVYRVEGCLGKTYPLLMATDGSGYYFQAVDRRYDGHHRDIGGSGIDWDSAFKRGWDALVEHR